MEFKEKLIKLFNEEYKSWEDYTKAFNKFSQELVSEKENLTSKLNEKDLSDEDMFDIQKMFVKYNLAGVDLNKKTTSISYFFMILNALDLKEELDKEIKSKMNKVLLSMRKDVFVPEKEDLKERVKGVLDSKTKEVMESELYKKMTSKI